MKKAIGKLTQHTLVYGIGHILPRAISFLLLPVHTNYLPSGVYGLVALLFAALAFLNIIFTYGMDSAFLRYYVLSDAKDEKKRVFSTAFWTILSTGILFSSCMQVFPALFSKWIFESSEYIRLIRIASGIVFMDAISLLPFLILRGEERSVHFTMIKFLNIILTFALNLLFIVHWHMGLQGVFLANLFASAGSLVMLFPTLVRWLRFKIDFSCLLQLLKFGIPYIPAGLAVIIMDQIGRFFLYRILGEEATGIFSASYKLGMIMAFVITAFRFAWHPFFLTTSKQEDAPRIFGRVLTYFILGTGFVFLLISFFIRDFVGIKFFGKVIFGSEFLPGISIVPIVLLAYIAYGMYINFMVGIYLKKKTQYLPLITGIGALTAVLLNHVLIPLTGIHGAAWATFGAYAMMALILGILSRFLYPVPYEWRILKIVLIGGVIFFIGRQSTDMLQRLFMLMCYPVLLFGFRFFYAEEIRTFKTWILRPFER